MTYGRDRKGLAGVKRLKGHSVLRSSHFFG